MAQIDDHSFTVHRVVEHDVGGSDIIVTERRSLRMHVLQAGQYSPEDAQRFLFAHRSSCCQTVCQNRAGEIIRQIVLVRTAFSLQRPVRYVAYNIAVFQLAAVFNLPYGLCPLVHQFGGEVIQDE